MTVLTQANLDAQQKAVRRARRLLDEAAERGQAVLVYSTEALLVSPAALTAIGGMSGPDALSSMGLTVVQEEGL